LKPCFRWPAHAGRDQFFGRLKEEFRILVELLEFMQRLGDAGTWAEAAPVLAAE